MCALQRITLSLFLGYAPVVHNYKIKMNFRRVALDRFQMLPRGVVVGLAGLSHQVANENLGGLAFTDRAGHSGHQQIRQDACVERTWPNRDDIRRADRFQHFGQRQTLFRLQSEATNRSARCRNLSFATNDSSVFEFRNQPHITNRRRINMTFAGQNFRRQSDRFSEIAGDFGKCCQEEVAKAVTAEFAISAKSMTKEARE